MIFLTVAFVGYPLFFKKIQPYELSGVDALTFSEREEVLAALSDLEDEFLLGQLSKQEYQTQKTHYQRRYLELPRQ